MLTDLTKTKSIITVNLNGMELESARKYMEGWVKTIRIVKPRNEIHSSQKWYYIRNLIKQLK